MSVEAVIADYSVTSRTPITGLSVTITNIYRSFTGTLHVVGLVRNDAAITYQYVEVIAAYVNASGLVVRTDFTFPSPSTLPPGQQAPFDILFVDAPPGLENLNLLIWTDATR